MDNPLLLQADGRLPVLISADAASSERTGVRALSTAAVSFGMHVLVSVALIFMAARPVIPQTVAVKMKIMHTEAAKPKPPAVEAPKPTPLPMPVPDKAVMPKKKPALAKKINSERTPPDKASATVKPVQGLSPSALAPAGKGVAAPVGNTLMTGDNGTRTKPEAVEPLSSEDLSAEAQLIAATIVLPEYTPEAIEVGLEGAFTVDVMVEADGHVSDVELSRKIGYGMDERVLAAARRAAFQPRKDRYGHPMKGWSNLHFRLEIPG